MAREKWNFDATHSSVDFVVRHMVVSKVRGRFTKWTGSVEFDAANYADSSLEVSIDVDSIDTHEAQRDGHLKSPDFFDVANHPKMTFKGTKFSGSGGDLKITGDLTIRGTTKEVTLDAEYLGTGKDPWGGTRAGFSAKTSILREDFGLTWNAALETGGVLVGKKVDIEIDVELVKA
jgi:polyisoprenoid-binding protein YceI